MWWRADPRQIVSDVEAHDTTGIMKAKMQGKEGIPPVQQSLVSRAEFDDDSLLSGYRNQKGSTLHLKLRLRGGTQILVRDGLPDVLYKTSGWGCCATAIWSATASLSSRGFDLLASPSLVRAVSFQHATEPYSARSSCGRISGGWFRPSRHRHGIL